MKLFYIPFLLAFSTFVYSQTELDDLKTNMTGTWKKQNSIKKNRYLNIISFSSDSTCIWRVSGIICDCEFFKIYAKDDKVYLQRLIISSGWSEPVEIVSANPKRLVTKHADGTRYKYKRIRAKKNPPSRRPEEGFNYLGFNYNLIILEAPLKSL